MTSLIDAQDTTKTAHPAVSDTAAPLSRKIYEPWPFLSLLVILGGISGLAYYLGFVEPYKLETYYKQPLQDLAKISGATASAANSWALTWAVLFACYFAAFRLCPPAGNVTRLFRRVALGIICGWAVFYAANLIFMYPVGAADLFDQIFRARLLSHYGLNPFTTLPANIAGDPLQAYVAWKGDPSPYGPVWEIVAAGVSLLAGGDLLKNLVFFKLLVVAAYGVSVALTYGILRERKPDWALRGTLFFAWNPLVLFEIAGNGHNDGIVALFLLAGVYLFVKAQHTASLPAIMAGALTKFVPGLLLPVLAAAIWHDRRKRDFTANGELPVRRQPLTNFQAFAALTIGAVVSVMMAVVVYAPFWEGTRSIGPLKRETLFTASLPKVALDVLMLRMGMEESAAQTLVRNGALYLIIAITITLAVVTLRGKNARTAAERGMLVERTLGAFYEIIFFYLAVATLWFQPWYLIWLVALTAPTASFTRANRTILFCIGGIANYFVWDFIWIWNKTNIHNNQITAAIAIYTLPLFYTLYVWTKKFAQTKTDISEPYNIASLPVAGASE